MHNWADIIQDQLKDNIENMVSQTLGLEKFEKGDFNKKYDT